MLSSAIMISSLNPDYVQMWTASGIGICEQVHDAVKYKT